MFVCIFCSIAAGIRADQEVTVAVFPGAAPVSFIDEQGHAAGLFPDLLERILTEAGYSSWAVMEWECAVKSPEQGAAEGAPFIAKHIIETSDVAFDDFAASGADVEANRRILGLS